MEVDPSFRRAAEASKKRRRQRRFRAIAGLSVGAVVLALSGWILFPGGGDGQNGAAPDLAVGETTERVPLVASEDAEGNEGGPRIRIPSTDVQGPPLLIEVDGSTREDVLRRLPGPEQGFSPARVGLPAPDRFTLLREEVVASQNRLQVVLPSSSADFALFGSLDEERETVPLRYSAAPRTVPVEAGTRVRVEEAGSWGDLIASDPDAPSDVSGNAAVYVQTRIENTTSVAVALREERRLPLFKDEVLVLASDRALADVLTGAGIGATAAERISTAFQDQFQLGTDIPDGSIVAVRFRFAIEGRQAAQISVYRPEGYVGSLALDGYSRYIPAADPWYEDRLLTRAGQMERETDDAADPRLIDAVYSVALSRGLPDGMVGQLIVALSRRYDLDRFAAPGDQLTILYATNPGSEGQGLRRIVYASLEGPSGSMPCYVLNLGGGKYGCFDPSAVSRRTGPGALLSPGLTTPVNGTKTSGFGPRHHPIFRQVRNHNGIDWAAPTGTPVVSALPGRIGYLGPGGGYGNVVYVDHADGVQTRYAHLDAFADGLAQGQDVGAGDLIGYVGSTGDSTGPHLHFELHVGGTPVDPLTWSQAENGSVTGNAAVEALVSQIIDVESAGVATAKNSRSSATGLGQFIDSTWLRMMADYRPDLYAEMTRPQLLELRFDPALSREMVRNLARENEAFLRARGHPVTPGTMYLAHFLGPTGAHRTLGADPAATALSVHGAQVVDANPHLRDMTVADLIAWADRKMAGTGTARSTTRTPGAIPAEVRAFQAAVDEMLGQI
ncbi:MAG: peptidoglycan DD-metalloendopeptidase family protein [Paracoccaceae bacterium]